MKRIEDNNLPGDKPLAKADLFRKLWRPCENCISCGNCSSAGGNTDDYPCADCISDYMPNGLLQASMRHFRPVGFCQYCGRPLTPKAWAELKKRLMVDDV